MKYPLNLLEGTTPGPWGFDSIDTPFQLAYGDVIGGDDSGDRVVYADEGNTTIAVLYKMAHGDDSAPQTANARLIEHAPTLARQLAEAIELLEQAASMYAEDREGEKATGTNPFREFLEKMEGENG